MLLEFKCSNHKSIKDEMRITTIATNDSTNEQMLIKYGKYRLHRSMAIYGANGSGKSNFIDAINFMKYLVVNSTDNKPGDKLFQAPHKLSDINDPSEYFMQFIKNDIRYAYGFSINQGLISEEYLYYYPNGRVSKVFTRENASVKLGDKFKGSFKNTIEALKDNKLFVSCAADLNSNEVIRDVYMFFKEDLIVYHENVNNWLEYSLEKLQDDPDLNKLFVNILNKLDIGVKGIDIKIEKVTLTQDDVKDIPEPLRQFFMSQPDTNKVEAKLDYGEFETNLMTEESLGIKKLFEILCPVIDIMYNGKILICDELERGLHELICKQLVELFQDENLCNNAQLIFSTHNTNLLNTSMFRRDQIWFTELNNSRATDLYALAEIKNVRKTEDIQKGYIQGRYGAIPILNSSIAALFEK